MAFYKNPGFYLDIARLNLQFKYMWIQTVLITDKRHMWLSFYLNMFLTPPPPTPLFFLSGKNYICCCGLYTGWLFLASSSVAGYVAFFVKDGQSRTVRQFQFTDWPEQGVPKSGEGFIDFIGQVHKTKEQFGQDGPISVHCRWAKHQEWWVSICDECDNNFENVLCCLFIVSTSLL